MADEEQLRPELRRIIEEFARFRETYVVLLTHCETQEELLAVERERSERMAGNLEKLSNTYLLLENRYKSIVEGLQSERDGLRKTIEELNEQCDHLRLINIDRNGNSNDQISRLEGEVEVLKARLLLQEEKHNEDLALLKQRHSDEIQRYKVSLKNAKQPSASSESRKRGRAKNLNGSEHSSYFRWPELNVRRTNNPLPAEEPGECRVRNKRRKLFSEDKEAEFDLACDDSLDKQAREG